VLRVAEREGVHSMRFDVGVEEAFQLSSGEVLAVPVASWETAQCHSGVVLVLQAVVEPFEPAPTDLLCPDGLSDVWNTDEKQIHTV
jgi:hypothetical protein